MVVYSRQPTNQGFKHGIFFLLTTTAFLLFQYYYYLILLHIYFTVNEIKGIFIDCLV